MALNYTTIFTHLGSFLARSNGYNTIAATTLATDLATLETALGTTWLPANNLPVVYAGFQGQVVSWRQRLGQYMAARLQDFATVLSQLGLPSTASIQQVLAALYAQMIVDAQTVKASVVSIGATTPASGNSGTGLVLATRVLDGYSNPLPGGAVPGQANVAYNTLLSQLAVPSESQQIVCSNDSQQGGLAEGSEQFSWAGAPQQPSFSYLAEGSGQLPGLICSNQYPLLQNRDFASWAAGLPAGWTVSAGSALVAKDTTAANVFRGSASVEITGDGATTFTMAQTIASPASAMRSKRRWLCGLACKVSAQPSAGALSLKFTGTSYTAAALTNTVQTVTVAGASGGHYTLVNPLTGATSGTINGSDVAATVQATLRAMVGLESVTVTQTGSTPNFTNTITFYGVPGNAPTLTVGTNSLTGGGTVTPATSTPGVEGEQINLPAAALPTGFAWRWFWINTPSVLPANWSLQVSLTGPFDNAKNFWFGSMVLAPVQYGGGIGANVIAGSSRWLKGDKVTVAVSNNQGGLFQDGFRRTFGVQLPSVTDSSQTISEGLVT